MDFIGLKHVTIFDDNISDNNFNFKWSKNTTVHAMVVLTDQQLCR